MITYKLLNLQELHREDLEAFIPLLSKHQLTIFSEKPGEGDTFLALVAYDGKQPVGLTFAHLIAVLEQGFIYTLFVKQKYRQKGIGTRLMALFLKELFKYRISFIQFRFNTYDPDAVYLQKILKKTGWHPPQIIIERYHFYSPTFAPDWYLHPGPTLTKNLKISLWQHLSVKQLDSIREIIRKNPLLQDVSPFDSPYPIEKVNSLVLKHHQEILGWMVTHRYDQETIRYSAFYVDRDLRGLGSSIALLKEAIRRQKASSVLHAFLEVNIKRSPPYWQHFIKKRLAPYCTKVDYSVISFIKKTP
ncbi:MAG: GNAT family N-acetyltransferase [Parachlamydiaceae bacterium]